jgi:hypothetical protein
MKLAEHVDYIRTLIYGAFGNQFSRLGLGPTKMMDVEKLPSELLSKRSKIEVLIINHTDEMGSYEEAREKALDELTFTLFNRLAAIKVMEAHQLFPPIVTKEAQHGDRSFGHKAWLELHPNLRDEELEGFRDYLKYEFNLLGETLPLYHRDYPYALLPYVIELNEIIDAFNEVEQDKQVEDKIWQSDDILGWLYESYNNVKKQAHKDSVDKTEYNKVSLQSQVYTPRWVVEFLVNNSLGKLYLEMYPDSDIKNQYKIANAPAERVRDKKPLHEIKLIDPASGSGNYLLYAFSFFHALYLDQIENYDTDYDENNIPQLIIENNLYGIDLDDRAAQLAQLGLWIKAKQKQRSIGKLNFNVVSSDFFLPAFDFVYPVFEQGISDKNQLNIVREIWEDLQQAHKFGSLVKIEEKLSNRLHGLVEQSGYTLFGQQEVDEYERFKNDFFKNLEDAVTRFAHQQGNAFIADKTHDAITFLKLITQKYDVTTANPPYTDNFDFGPELKQFIEINYKKPHKFHTNLYATFIKRCYELCNEEGKIAIIHPRTFMFIKTFEGVRKFILEHAHLNCFVDFGYGNIFGSILIDPVFYVFEKKNSNNKKAWFISLDQYTRTPKEKFKKDFALEALTDYINGKANPHNFALSQTKLKVIKSYPFIYWISDEFREKFKGDLAKDMLANCQGLATTNNNRFLRFWWEINDKMTSSNVDNKWFLYAKGGPFKKWDGNLWLVVNFANNGKEIKKEVVRKYPYLNGKTEYVVKNEIYYLKEGISYSASGQKGPSFRLLPEGCIFDVGGSCIFPLGKYKNINYILALYNSKLTNYIIDCLNPTVNVQAGDIERLPFVTPNESEEKIINQLSLSNRLIVSNLNSKSIIDRKYSINLFSKKENYSASIKSYLNYENHLTSHVIINEAIINKKIFEVYELSEDDKTMILAAEGQSIGELPLSMDAKQAYLENEFDNFSLNAIQEFIENLSEKAFTASERGAIENEFAHLYQSNNDIEEFCIRHQVNPINVWYWFKQSSVIPKQRMNDLAMEFLADILREILMEDEDGIIPLVPNAGEKILLDRVEEKFIEKGFTMAQYSSFDSVLGGELNDYINHHFFKNFSDHLNLFMYLPKTPFIWHLTSGPEQGFDCYIIIYKWNKDRLLRLRSVYIENRERALINRQTDLLNKELLSAAEQTEADKIYKQLKEIESFKRKIDELLEEGYDPILDDGVGKNIAPLQKKGMLSYEVLNKGQVKKYLNADW